jgi:hypothetical protein
MPDDLYWDDTLLWSEQQAARLRRVAAGERVNDVDWEHVIEEIEDVGKSELHACESLIFKEIQHLLKLRGWPGHTASEHWRNEIVNFRSQAILSFAPSMRQKIDVADLYQRAARSVRAMTMDQVAPHDPPQLCPFTLDLLIDESFEVDGLLGLIAIDQPPAA